MNVQNDEFNKYWLLQFGRTITKEELEFIENQITQDITDGRIHPTRIEESVDKAIEVLKKLFESIVKDEKIDIEKELRKTTIDVLEEVGKLKSKNEEQKRMLVVICEYIKMTIK